MTKLELQNKIATIEKSMAKITNPAVLAIAEKNLKQAREQLAALEGATPSPAPSGGGSELEKLYEQREKLRKGLQSSNAVVQKASKMALPKVEAQIAELEGAKPAPAPARRMPKPKAEKPAKAPAKRGRKPKAETPAEEKPKIKRGRKPKAEAPAEEKPKIKRGRKPKAEAPAEAPAKTPAKRGRKPKAQAPAEVPAITPARRGRPALPKGAKSKEVSLNSLTKLANAIVEFCEENGIANPTLDDVRGILNILDKNKALKFAKGGKISRSGKYLSKWQIKQILTDGGMKIGSDEILSGVWLKKKVDGVAEMRMGGGVGYFAIKDDIIESQKSVRFGNRRVSSRNPKVVGVLEGKMVGNLMKVYDYDDEMWKVVNPDEWQQAYADGGGVDYVGNLNISDYSKRGTTDYKEIKQQITKRQNEQIKKIIGQKESILGNNNYKVTIKYTPYGEQSASVNKIAVQKILDIIGYGTKLANGGGVGSGSFLRYEGQSILLHSVPSPKYERFLDKEIVIEKIDKNKIVKSFVRETGEKVPFIIDDTFKKEEYAKGGGVGENLVEASKRK